MSLFPGSLLFNEPLQFSLKRRRIRSKNENPSALSYLRHLMTCNFDFIEESKYSLGYLDTYYKASEVSELVWRQLSDNKLLWGDAKRPVIHRRGKILRAR